MSNIPAFPKPKLMQQAVSFEQEDGMTLRDYFAAKAMQAILSDPEISDTNKVKKWISISSYAIADEMLKVREQ